MSDELDPSARRDAAAKETATSRSNNAALEIVAMNRRLDTGDKRMNRIEENQEINLRALEKNTAATEEIAHNTKSLVSLASDLASGTRFMCRCATFVKFLLKDIVEPFWKPALIVFCVIYWLTNNHVFPSWLGSIPKMIGG